MCYPDRIIKGIKSENQIFHYDDQHEVGLEVFYFNDESKFQGFKEQSINWEDDDHSIEFTLSSTKTTGELRFKGGVVLLNREDFDKISQQQKWKDKLLYKRDRSEANPYHGLLLLAKDICTRENKRKHRLLAATLANYSSFVITR